LILSRLSDCGILSNWIRKWRRRPYWCQDSWAICDKDEKKISVVAFRKIFVEFLKSKERV
jgi:hypothetical protein